MDTTLDGGSVSFRGACALEKKSCQDDQGGALRV